MEDWDEPDWEDIDWAGLPAFQLKYLAEHNMLPGATLNMSSDWGEMAFYRHELKQILVDGKINNRIFSSKIDLILDQEDSEKFLYLLCPQCKARCTAVYYLNGLLISRQALRREWVREALSLRWRRQRRVDQLLGRRGSLPAPMRQAVLEDLKALGAGDNDEARDLLWEARQRDDILAAKAAALATADRERKARKALNLERYIDAHREFYLNALVWAFKRHHDGADPPEYAIPEDKRSSLASRGYRLLEHLSRIPGTREDGEIDPDKLMAWIEAVRRQAAELDRLEMAYHNIGKLFSSAPKDPDGVWPCKVVRDAMEDVASEDMMRGAQMGRYNARGAHWRGSGGDQERAIAAEYRGWAEAVQVSNPFVASRLLMGMVRTYEAEADREDHEAGIRRRLR